MFVKTTALPSDDKQIVAALGTVCQKLFVDENGKLPVVIRGYVNRVTKPKGDDYILITPMGHVLLSQKVTAWDDEASAKSIMQPTRRRVQVDCYGSKADVWAKALTACLVDISFLDIMKEFGVQTLWVEGPQDMTDADDNEQYHPRYMLDVQVQVNPITTVELESFIEVVIQQITLNKEILS